MAAGWPPSLLVTPRLLQMLGARSWPSSHRIGFIGLSKGKPCITSVRVQMNIPEPSQVNVVREAASPALAPGPPGVRMPGSLS